MHLKAIVIAAGIAFAVSLPSIAADTESGKHLFILSGQSNMREPLIGTFADTVKKALGENKVIVTSYGQPSQPIRRWCKNWAPPEGMTAPPSDCEMYDKLLAGVQKAIQGQTLKSVTFVWMQGEADGQAGWGAVYEKSFLGIVDQLKADLKRDDVTFVLGRINDHHNDKEGNGRAVVREAQVRLGTKNANGTWVNTDDLNTGINPWNSYEIDGEHFPNPGYRIMGQRFAHEACKLADPKAKLDEALFAEALPDDAHKVKTNLAFGKPITGTQPDPGHSGGKAGLSALVDGKLGAPDSSDPAWLGFPPTEKNIEFVIDLGKATDISSVAINLLNDHSVAAHFPNQIDVQVSADGSEYRHLCSGRSEVVAFDKNARLKNLNKDFKSQATLVFIDKTAPGARFVKVKIVPDTASNSSVFLDEIMINPVMK